MDENEIDRLFGSLPYILVDRPTDPDARTDASKPD